MCDTIKCCQQNSSAAPAMWRRIRARSYHMAGGAPPKSNSVVEPSRWAMAAPTTLVMTAFAGREGLNGARVVGRCIRRAVDLGPYNSAAGVTSDDDRLAIFDSKTMTGIALRCGHLITFLSLVVKPRGRIARWHDSGT